MTATIGSFRYLYRLSCGHSVPLDPGMEALARAAMRDPDRATIPRPYRALVDCLLCGKRRRIRGMAVEMNVNAAAYLR